jgi:hypothetical protein
LRGDMSNDDFTYEINDIDIPPADIKKHPAALDIIAFNNRELLPGGLDLILDNTDPSTYDDRYAGSLFFSIDWYGDEVTIYDNDLNIYVYKGLVRSLEIVDSNRTMIVKTANYIQNLKSICDYVNTGTDKTPAETVKEILLDSDMGNIPSSIIDERSFQKAINIQSAAGVYIYVDYDIEDNKKCLDVINEILRMSQMSLFDYNGRIYLYQWQAWNGIIGERIAGNHLIEKSYKHYFDEKNIVNYYKIAYQSGASIAWSTGSDSTSIGRYGRRGFLVPNEQIDSTTATDFKIRFKNATGAVWAGGLALSRYQTIKKYFDITIGDEMRFLELNEQIDLDFDVFVREPSRIVEMRYDKSKSTIKIKGLFLNVPNQYYSRDDDPPAAPELISIFSGGSSLTIKWTVNQEPDILGYKVYFTSSPGEWQSEYCNRGISPVDIKNPTVDGDGYNTLTIYELNPGTIYYVKVKAYDTSFNLSRDSNVINLLEEEEKHFVQGDIYDGGITLDINNTAGGAALPGTILYDEAFYDEEFYTYTAHYESAVLFEENGFTSISWSATGDADDIRYQYRESNNSDDLGDWSDEEDAIGSKTLSLTKKYLQIRFIFYSESWNDTDSVEITEVV